MRDIISLIALAVILLYWAAMGHMGLVLGIMVYWSCCFAWIFHGLDGGDPEPTLDQIRLMEVEGSSKVSILVAFIEMVAILPGIWAYSLWRREPEPRPADDLPPLKRRKANVEFG